MKILHTSDWHIGKKLYNQTLDETLQLFFEWLISKVEEQKVEYLIVAGDIFNTPFPSQSSLKLYYTTLYKLTQTNLKKIILIAGNHDSPATLNAPKDILEILDIKIISSIPQDLNDLIIELKDYEGNLKAVVAAVPYLREKDLKKSVLNETYEENLSAVSNGIIDFYKNIEKLTNKYRKENIPIIATGHLYILPQRNTDIDSENYMLGGIQQLSIEDLPAFYDYFALGHIHKPLKLDKIGKIRYCGSPIHMNFSEAGEKQCVLLTVENNEISSKKIIIPKYRDLLNVSGTFNEVCKILESYKNDYQQRAWAEVTIVEKKQDSLIEQKILDLRDRLTEIEILHFKYKFTDIETEIENKISTTKGLDELRPMDIFEKIIENENEDYRDELKTTMKELITRMNEDKTD